MVFIVEIREVYNLEYYGEWKRFEIRNISPLHLLYGVVESCEVKLRSRVRSQVKPNWVETHFFIDAKAWLQPTQPLILQSWSKTMWGKQQCWPRLSTELAFTRARIFVLRMKSVELHEKHGWHNFVQNSKDTEIWKNRNWRWLYSCYCFFFK